MARKKDFTTQMSDGDALIAGLKSDAVGDLTAELRTEPVAAQQPVSNELSDATKLAIRNSQYSVQRIQQQAQVLQQNIQKAYEQALQDQQAIVLAAYASAGLKPEEWNLDGDTLTFVPVPPQVN